MEISCFFRFRLEYGYKKMCGLNSTFPFIIHLWARIQTPDPGMNADPTKFSPLLIIFIFHPSRRSRKHPHEASRLAWCCSGSCPPLCLIYRLYPWYFRGICDSRPLKLPSFDSGRGISSWLSRNINAPAISCFVADGDFLKTDWNKSALDVLLRQRYMFSRHRWGKNEDLGTKNWVGRERKKIWNCIQTG